MICAFGNQNIFKETHSKKKAVKHNDNEVYWYCVRDESFGFSDTEDIDLNAADTIDGEKRLSWHLEGIGINYSVKTNEHRWL